MAIKKQYLKSRPVCKATFSLTAPEAKGVKIVGDFNDWNLETGFEMKRLKSGVFKATLNLDRDQDYQFRYLIDGTDWENDWEADAYVPTPYGVENSVAVL